jgi:hypothetical protein
MKFSELDKNLLTEAPAADGGSKEGKMARMGTKLKKKLGPTKNIRNRASGKAEVQQQALDIKQQFQKWAGANDMPNTAKSLIAFFQDETNNYAEKYAAAVPEVAVKLQFEPEGFDRETSNQASDEAPAGKPDATGKQQAQPDDSADQKADEVNPDEEQEDMVSPEEMTGEADEEVEEEVDMSASIYESKLAYYLMEDTKLKDNQLDTLLVRVVQAVGGKPQQQQQQEPEASEEKPGMMKKLAKGAGKLSKKAAKGLVGDLAPDSWGGEDGEGSSGSGGSGGSGLTSTERKQLKIILKQAIEGKQLDKDQRRVAKELLDDL